MHELQDTLGEFLDATVSGISGGAGDITASMTAAKPAIADAVSDEARGSITSQPVASVHDSTSRSTR